ncbi:hypothetical protein BOX15_Mlig034239g2, partial [Macrostomum lignano]
MMHPTSVYVSCQIGGQVVSACVDSGAAVTIINEALFQRVRKTWTKSPPSIQPHKSTIHAANGSPINISAICQLPLVIGESELSMTALVSSSVSYELLMGADFLLKHNCRIDFQDGVLHLADASVPLRFHQRPATVCRILASERIVVPPGAEKIASGRFLMKGGRGRYTRSPGVIEESQDRKRAGSAVLARSLVMPTEDARVPVRLANFSEVPVTIRKGETVAWYHPLDPLQPIALATLSEAKDAAPTLEKPRQEESEAAEELLAGLKNWGSCGLSAEQEAKFKALIQCNRDVFATELAEATVTNVSEHRIDTGTARPIKQAPRRLPPHLRAEVDEQLDELLAQGKIEEAMSPWSSPVVCVRKKDNSLRMCVDYRRVNDVTVKDAIPLPRVDEALEALHGTAVYSSLDLRSGYHQVPVAAEDRDKTAFAVPHRGQFRWLVMPFGVTNGPATFSRIMQTVLHPLAWKICLVYLDDILVFSNTVEDHLARLSEIFQRLRNANLKLNPKKCELLSSEVSFLGHRVSADGIGTDPEKVRAIREWPTPCTVKDVQAFLDTVGYYRRFIQDFSHTAEPLTELTRSTSPFQWGSAQEEAFQRLKEALTGEQVMAYPNFAPDAPPFILDTDGSSSVGIGGVLSQLQPDGSEKVIAYGSRTLSSAERNYCTTRVELLAVVTFIRQFKYFLLGKHFILRTDHSSLRWLHSFKNVEGQAARWLEQLACFDYTIIHRAGRDHGNADEKAYYQRIRHAHPDKVGPGARRQAQEINEAYRVLSDPFLRIVYEQFGPEGAQAPKMFLSRLRLPAGMAIPTEYFEQVEISSESEDDTEDEQESRLQLIGKPSVGSEDEPVNTAVRNKLKRACLRGNASEIARLMAEIRQLYSARQAVAEVKRALLNGLKDLATKKIGRSKIVMSVDEYKSTSRAVREAAHSLEFRCVGVLLASVRRFRPFLVNKVFRRAPMAPGTGEPSRSSPAADADVLVLDAEEEDLDDLGEEATSGG